MSSAELPEWVQVVDSHTEGEPTRVVVAGVPPMSGRDMDSQALEFERRFGMLRRALVTEPRAAEIVVGALLLPPPSNEFAAGIVFFNNVGLLGMCGHGLIGVVATLHHLGRVSCGGHRFMTRVGPVQAELEPSGSVVIQNVPASRLHKDVEVTTEDGVKVKGDVAYGGNWFFLVKSPQSVVARKRIPELHRFAAQVQAAVNDAGITGQDGAPIDHVELFDHSDRADSRSFVLCPGGQYDRSPCGTGTSAKLACLHADGLLTRGQIWRQESVTGGMFEAWLDVVDGALIPHLRGRAHITGEAKVLFCREDPLRWGIDA